MSALEKIKKAGFNIGLEKPNCIWIEPFSKLTPKQLEFIKSHKLEIIEELKQTDNDSSNLEQIKTWFDWIGEDDPKVINEILEKCQKNTESFQYFLMRSKVVH
jgi:hypothetical protein